MSTVGYAVGDWNSGKKVYPNPEFVNFGRGLSNQIATIRPFYIDRLTMRNANSQLGVNWNDYNKRKVLVNKYGKQGVTLNQINDFWEEYNSRGLDAKNLQAFDVFIRQQRLLQQAQIKKEEELLAQLEEEEKQKEISDLNLFPPIYPEPQPDPFSVKMEEESKPNYLLYGGIALAVLVGGFIILKRR